MERSWLGRWDGARKISGAAVPAIWLRRENRQAGRPPERWQTRRLPHYDTPLRRLAPLTRLAHTPAREFPGENHSVGNPARLAGGDARRREKTGRHQRLLRPAAHR